MKYKVIAEGVEVKEQLNALVNLGCNIIQGYYFSKPVCEEELEKMLKMIK
ncbi:EAL domain-containing protein [Clostridium beijerinckii]|nr:EAL domain-containing protein [Clostridium beijerinckii]